MALHILAGVMVDVAVSVAVFAAFQVRGFIATGTSLAATTTGAGLTNARRGRLCRRPGTCLGPVICRCSPDPLSPPRTSPCLLLPSCLPSERDLPFPPRCCPSSSSSLLRACRFSPSEIFDRNVGKDSPLKLDRGANRLYRDGGLMFPLVFN
jgi:hypothetical protein